MFDKIKEILGFNKPKPIYKIPKRRLSIEMREFHQNERTHLTDGVLLLRFKVVRNQCKYGGRRLDVLLEYMNELEYRGIKYRL